MITLMLKNKYLYDYFISWEEDLKKAFNLLRCKATYCVPLYASEY